MLDIGGGGGGSDVREEDMSLRIGGVEFSLYEFEGSINVQTASIVGEADFEIVFHGFFFKKIVFVEKDDSERVFKPPAVANFFKESKRLMHAIDGVVFEQGLVIFGKRDEKDQRCDVFKAMNPFSALRA